jgi:ubiquinone/menaquinone biosynthesis C-methylase UbiE
MVSIIPSDILGIQRNGNDEVLFLHEALNSLPSSGYVLDAGSGTGSFDHSTYDFITVALDRYVLPKNSPINGRFVRGDLSYLPYKDTTFDFIVLSWVMEHVHKPRQCLREVWRVLKDNGLVYVAVPNGQSLCDRIYRTVYLEEGGHVQKYTFYSFCRLAYDEKFRLLSFCEWPSAYTWLQNPPNHPFWSRVYQMTREATGHHPCEVWLRLLSIIHRLTRYNTLSKGNWVMLLQKTETHNLREITHVCHFCGSGVTVNDSLSYESEGWECPSCHRINYFV